MLTGTSRILCCLCLLFAACEPEKKQDEPKKKATEEAVPVEVLALEHGPIEDLLQASAHLEVESEVKVIARTENRVVELLVEEGDRVTKDDLLLRLEDDSQQLQVDKTRIQKEKAQREFDRKKNLFQREMISEEEYNNVIFDLDKAKLEHREALRELEFTRIKAPITGTITSRLINLGDQISVGQHLFDLVDFDTMVARIHVPEKHLPRLNPGILARITSTAAPGIVFQGRVIRIAPTVDAQSGTVKVTVGVNRDNNAAMLRPSMYVQVNLVLEVDQQALLVPKKALVYDSDRMYAFRLVENRRVERLHIQPLLSNSEHIQPADQLQAGDQIVVAGQSGLKDGALVRLPGDPLPETEEERPETE